MSRFVGRLYQDFGGEVEKSEYHAPLTEFTLPDTVREIPPGAFHGCKYLTGIRIRIPEGVISIGEMAFISCWSLTSIDIPKGVTSIEGGTFYWCRRR